jgi:hypothetical protein
MYPIPTTITQPFSATLHRLTSPEHYTIRSVKEFRQNENYYLVLFLKEASTDPGPPLDPLTPNAIQEKIESYEI